MNDDTRLRTLFQDAVARRGATSDEPIDVNRLSALAEGRLDEGEALPLLDRVFSDDAMRREFELLRAVHEAGARSAHATPRWGVRHWALLAAAMLVVAVLPATWNSRRASTESATVRGGAERVVLIAPAEESIGGAALTFTWAAVPDAVRYRLEIVDTIGEVVAELETGDTLARIPAGRLPVDATLHWTVEARTPVAQLRATPRSLRLRAP